MIEVGSIIRRWNDETSWLVIHSTDKVLIVHDVNNVNDVSHFPPEGTPDQWGKRMPYTIVSYPAPALFTTPVDYRTELIERLAYNNGSMEMCLELTWSRLVSMENNANRDNHFGLSDNVRAARESIERTAQFLKAEKKSDGTEVKPRLFTMIYGNRK